MTHSRLYVKFFAQSVYESIANWYSLRIILYTFVGAKTMVTETIDHTTLTKLAEAGVVRSAHVIGQAGGWGILVKYGMTERALAAQRSHQVRVFRKLETLVAYLKGVGIPRFDVDSVNYDPANHATARTR